MAARIWCVVTWGEEISFHPEGGSLGCCLLGTCPRWDRVLVAGVGPALGWGGHYTTGRRLAAGPSVSPSSVFFARQQYSSFQMDKLECGQLGSWRASPPVHTPVPPEQQLHSEGGDLLYAPSYSLPFSYHYGHFPLDSHVFSSKKPMLPAKFGQPQGSPCEVARFLLSTLPASGECQWHYANPLVPGSQSPAKRLSEPPVNPARHSLVPNYEGGSCLHEGRGQGCAQRCRWVADGKRTLTLWANFPFFSASKWEWLCFPALTESASRGWPKAGQLSRCASWAPGTV